MLLAWITACEDTPNRRAIAATVSPGATTTVAPLPRSQLPPAAAAAVKSGGGVRGVGGSYGGVTFAGGPYREGSAAYWGVGGAYDGGYWEGGAKYWGCSYCKEAY